MGETKNKIKLIDEYCKSKKACIYEYKLEWKASRYLLFDKMFLMVGEDNKGHSVATLKLEPLKGEILRENFKDKITPGYYMNKVHWNTIYLESDVEIALIKELIDDSYNLVFNGLTKKRQAEINANN